MEKIPHGTIDNLDSIRSSKTPTKIENTMEQVINEADKIEIKENDRNKEGYLLVSPDGPVSNLGIQNDLWWKIARTESFKKFFGDWQKNPENSSKIVDQNGEPLVVFRGLRHLDAFNNGISTSDFYNKKLYAASVTSKGPAGKGVHSSPDPELASFYAGKDGIIVPAFVNARTIKPKKPIDTVLDTIDTINKDIILFFSKKLLKYVPQISPNNKYDASFCDFNNHKKNEDKWNELKTNHAYDAGEIVVKDPNNILIIPNPIEKITKSIVEDSTKS